VAQLRECNGFLEAELKTQERHITNALKDNIVRQQQPERMERRGLRRR